MTTLEAGVLIVFTLIAASALAFVVTVCTLLGSYRAWGLLPPPEDK